MHEWVEFRIVVGADSEAHHLFACQDDEIVGILVWRETWVAIRQKESERVSHGRAVSGALESVNTREWVWYPPKAHGRDGEEKPEAWENLWPIRM